MPKQKITKRIVDALEEGQCIWDTEVFGFGVRRQKVYRVYILKTILNGRQKFITIGKHGSPWTADSAREEALRLLIQVRQGVDPRPIKSSNLPILTVKELCQKYLAEYAINKKPRSEHSDRRLIHNHIIPLLGTTTVTAVVRSDIEKFREAVRAGKTAPANPKAVQLQQRGGHPVRGGHGVANRCLTLLSKIFNLAEDWDLRPQNSNPVRRVKKYREHKRDRFLSIEEISRLGEELSEVKLRSADTYALAALRLLIFTGARLSEILTLRWEWVQFDQRLILLPDSKTGRKAIRLSQPAIETLQNLRRIDDNPFVICGSKRGTHLVNLQKTWVRIRARAKIENVRIHDLRHTFASVAVSTGNSLEVVGSLLGHKTIQTTSRYAHLRQDHVVLANEQVGKLLAEFLDATK